MAIGKKKIQIRASFAKTLQKSYINVTWNYLFIIYLFGLLIFNF